MKHIKNVVRPNHKENMGVCRYCEVKAITIAA